MSSTFIAFFARVADALGAAWRLAVRRNESLNELDDRTLADIGVSRSEIASIEAEWRGQTRATRRRIVAEPRHA